MFRSLVPLSRWALGLGHCFNDMTTTDEQPPIEYMSYNGLGRNPMIWGIPYMASLAIMCISLLGGMMLGTFVGGAGWLFVLVGVPIALFIKSLCETDDKAVDILLLEIKWTLIRLMTSSGRYYGGTLAIVPIRYGRRHVDTKRYFETAIQRRKSAPEVQLSRS